VIPDGLFATPELAQERRPLGMRVTLLALTDDLSIELVQCREQRRCAVALVVVCHRLRALFFSGEPGCLRSRQSRIEHCIRGGAESRDRGRARAIGNRLWAISSASARLGGALLK
jgi:hypothetical protein